MKDIKRFFENNDIFARHCGIELLEVEPGYAKASMKIEPCHYNAANTVHGGAIFTLADFAFAAASNSHGTLAMSINAGVSFVKAATKGILHAVAREKSRSPRVATYLVEVIDDDGEMVALLQGTVYRKKESVIPANQ